MGKELGPGEVLQRKMSKEQKSAGLQIANFIPSSGQRSRQNHLPLRGPATGKKNRQITHGARANFSQASGE